MAQRDPLVEYQREGFDMFAAMMESIKEESVGFLFNLEVQVEEPTAEAEPAPGPAGSPEPTLDLALLAAADAETAADSRSGNGRAAPQISAKGLGRDTSARPMIYSAPELGSETPSVQLAKADGDGVASNTARRQQARSANPNRGSRGNKGGGKATKRKR